jgi:hypothetical protein
MCESEYEIGDAAPYYFAGSGTFIMDLDPNYYRGKYDLSQ